MLHDSSSSFFPTAHGYVCMSSGLLFGELDRTLHMHTCFRRSFICAVHGSCAVCMPRWPLLLCLASMLC